MGKNWLITGGAGFIGSHIVRRLLSVGEKVRVIDNLSSGKLKNLDGVLSKIEFIKGDIRDTEKLSAAMKGIDYVLHQAAIRSVPKSIENPIEVNDVNVFGTLNVLRAAKDADVRRLVYASSSSVYGDADEFPQKESSAKNPMSPYAVSKLAAEMYCKIWNEIYGLETVSLRYFNVYGEGQDFEGAYAPLIPKLVNSAIKDLPITIYGNGKQSRDFTYIDDVISANIAAMTCAYSAGKTYNIGGGNSASINKILDYVSLCLKKKLNIIYAPKRDGDILRTMADISLAKSELNYKPLPFVLGLEKTINNMLI